MTRQEQANEIRAQLAEAWGGGVSEVIDNFDDDQITPIFQVITNFWALTGADFAAVSKYYDVVGVFVDGDRIGINIKLR